VAGRQFAQARGATDEDAREIGETNVVAVGDLAQCTFAVPGRGYRGTAFAQGLPTS
jgi:hypothetical protein